MATWTAFPHAGDYKFDAASLKKNWDRLHQGDCEALPKEAAVLQAWALFHNGEFQKAFDAGIKAGGHGITVANKAAVKPSTLPLTGTDVAELVAIGGAAVGIGFVMTRRSRHGTAA